MRTKANNLYLLPTLIGEQFLRDTEAILLFRVPIPERSSLSATPTGK